MTPVIWCADIAEWTYKHIQSWCETVNVSAQMQKFLEHHHRSQNIECSILQQDRLNLKRDLDDLRNDAEETPAEVKPKRKHITAFLRRVEELQDQSKRAVDGRFGWWTANSFALC